MPEWNKREACRLSGSVHPYLNLTGKRGVHRIQRLFLPHPARLWLAFFISPAGGPFPVGGILHLFLHLPSKAAHRNVELRRDQRLQGPGKLFSNGFPVFLACKVSCNFCMSEPPALAADLLNPSQERLGCFLHWLILPAVPGEQFFILPIPPCVELDAHVCVVCRVPAGCPGNIIIEQ